MTLQAWYRLQAPKRLWDHDMPRSVSHAMHLGMVVQDYTIREGDGHTRLAEFFRHGEKPLVRLVLPNPLTIGRHRLIRDVVEKEGGSWFCVPLGTLEAASIIYDSIEVIHTKRSKHPVRADEQLLRATVRTEADRRWDNMWGDYRSRPTTRTAYFLSGYDQNERGLSYFFCELPPGAEPTTVDEAYAVLVPESVKIAKRARRKVKRQGDMFFVRMPRRWEPSKTPDDTYRLHRSNHYADQGVTQDGVLYVTGTIKHAPMGRRADHRPLKLGRRWWISVRNTVPVVG